LLEITMGRRFSLVQDHSALCRNVNYTNECPMCMCETYQSVLVNMEQHNYGAIVAILSLRNEAAEMREDSPDSGYL